MSSQRHVLTQEKQEESKEEEKEVNEEELEVSKVEDVPPHGFS